MIVSNTEMNMKVINTLSYLLISCKIYQMSKPLNSFPGFYNLQVWISFSFSFDHCVVCSSSTYRLWLPLWYSQTPLSKGITKVWLFNINLRLLTTLLISSNFFLQVYNIYTLIIVVLYAFFSLFSCVWKNHITTIRTSIMSQ